MKYRDTKDQELHGFIYRNAQSRQIKKDKKAETLGKFRELEVKFQCNRNYL